jgi:hypothetical protein
MAKGRTLSIPSTALVALALTLALGGSSADAQRGGRGGGGGGQSYSRLPGGAGAPGSCVFDKCFSTCIGNGGCDGSNILARCCSVSCSRRCRGQPEHTEGRF